MTRPRPHHAGPGRAGPGHAGSREGGDSVSSPSPKAVALTHDRTKPSVPRLVAKGRGKLAEQIVEIAFSRGVKVRKDADLTEILSQLDIDSEIPLESFAAVAEILSYVYLANDAMAGVSRESHPPDSPCEAPLEAEESLASPEE